MEHSRTMLPSTPQKVTSKQTSLVNQLQCSLLGPDDNTSARVIDDETRKKAPAAAKELVATLEVPTDVVMRYAWESPSQRLSLRVGAQLRLFHILAEQDGKPISAAELADRSKAELLLIVHIMRVLTAIGFVADAGEQSYVSTLLTKAVTIPELKAALKICHDDSGTVLMRMNDYFQTHGYKCPTDYTDCALQWTFNSKATYFEYIHETSERMGDFNTLMKGQRSTRKHFVEWFPLESELMSGFSGGADDILIVDVGGGRGHDLERILGDIPSFKGHLVLQDLPGTISDIKGLSEGIKPMAHDFFTPQPIKGARAYYTYLVFHDWPDEICRKILRNLMSAMKPNYSKILINECVLPNRDCPSFAAAGDLNMMSIFGGMERTHQQWIILLESVDLQVVRILESPYENDAYGIIEAMLKV